jgi:hypothetical protein
MPDGAIQCDPTVRHGNEPGMGIEFTRFTLDRFAPVRLPLHAVRNYCPAGGLNL